MTNKQPEALRLADDLEAPVPGVSFLPSKIERQAAAELRRLHDLTQHQDALLRQALEALEHASAIMDSYAQKRQDDAISAIRKHLKGTQ